MLAEVISFVRPQIAAVYSYVLQFFFSVWWVLRLRPLNITGGAIWSQNGSQAKKGNGWRSGASTEKRTRG